MNRNVFLFCRRHRRLRHFNIVVIVSKTILVSYGARLGRSVIRALLVLVSGQFSTTITKSLGLFPAGRRTAFTTITRRSWIRILDVFLVIGPGMLEQIVEAVEGLLRDALGAHLGPGGVLELRMHVVDVSHDVRVAK